MPDASIITSYSWEHVSDNERWLTHKGRFFRAGWCPCERKQGTWALEEFDGRKQGAALVKLHDRAVPTLQLSERVIEVIYG